MNQRKYRVVGRPFAAVGVSITTDAWDSRLKNIHAELLADVPCLAELQASVVELRFELTLQGAHLVVYLLESPQLQLPCLTMDKHKEDLFLQDIERAVKDQQSIEDRIALAIGPAVNPSGQPKIIEIRKRLKVPRGQGSTTILTTPEATNLPLFHLPKVLPLAGHESVHVRVTKLTSLWAEVTLCDSLQLALPHTVLRGTKMSLKRCGDHQRHETGARLAYAMDTKTPLCVSVALLLDWSTGRPKWLELLQIIEPPSNGELQN